jgi:hypothetical protein
MCVLTWLARRLGQPAPRLARGWCWAAAARLEGGAPGAPEGGELVGQLLHLLRDLLALGLRVAQLLLRRHLQGRGWLRQQRPQLLHLLRHRQRYGGRHLLPQLRDLRIGLVDLRGVCRGGGD